MNEDDVRYLAVQSRDARFDGWFFVAVTSTGIYCRPSCASVTPGRDKVRFYPTAAAAQRAGFRACKRCRPDASPGSPEWDRRDDVVARAMRGIADGVVDRDGVGGLAAHLGYSSRQLGRLLLAEVGAGPLQLARAQRAQTARVLLETTTMAAAEVAFAAGFGSVRQFNETVRAVFGEPPTALRERALRRDRGRGALPSPGHLADGHLADGHLADGHLADGHLADGHLADGHTSGDVSAPPAPRGGGGAVAGRAGMSVTVRLAYRAPLEAPALFGFLAERAVPGVEEGDSTSYRRALSLPHGHGVVTLSAPAAGERWVRANFVLDDLRDLTAAVKRVRRAFDLDCDPEAVAQVLVRDPLLGFAARSRPGFRVPGAADPEELALRAVLGQQVSVPGARSLAGRLAASYGEPLAHAVGSVVRSFPAPAALAELGPAHLPMPAARARALAGLAGALASGEVDLGPAADRDEAAARLAKLPGIGPWTVSYVRMRAMGDPDAFLSGDLGLRRALERAGLPASPREAEAISTRWRPYRAYALMYLWSGLAGESDERESVA
jgi:AraC family transcriptional regulator of adaptative response / DNA-3-methyladenine glycosylase II